MRRLEPATTRRLVVVFVIGAILGLTVSSAVGLGTASPTRWTLDADHGLDTEQKQVEFAETGSATTSLTAPDLSITVASEHDTCDIDGFHSDVRNDYLCLEYGEEIDRQLRVFIPAEYWHPYVRETVDPVAGDQSATFEPVQGGRYTAVTVTLDEPGTYAWAINAEASYFAGAKERTLENIENLTGVGAPADEEWQYIRSSELGGNQSAYALGAPNGTDALLLEYNTSDGWTSVPDQEQSYAPVYYQSRDGVNDRVFVFSTVENPPEVRYKTQPGATDQLTAALREIGQIPSRIEEIFGFDIPFL